MSSCSASSRSGGRRVDGGISPRRIATPRRSTVSSNVVGGWTGEKTAATAGERPCTCRDGNGLGTGPKEAASGPVRDVDDLPRLVDAPGAMRLDVRASPDDALLEGAVEPADDPRPRAGGAVERVPEVEERRPLAQPVLLPFGRVARAPAGVAPRAHLLLGVAGVEEQAHGRRPRRREIA